MKTALIFGSSGLIGNQLFNIIVQNNNYRHIKLFVRSVSKKNNSKVEIFQTDFTNLEKHKDSIVGDDCFFCIGTTKKDTPNMNEYRRIEYNIPIKVAQIAEYEGILRNFKFDMIVTGYGQSRSPGNEQRYMWGSEAADTPGSRNYMGIKNPAIDELIDTIVKAASRTELIATLQALDRILTHQFYIVPHWYIAYDRVVYWQKFSRPKINPSQSPIINNILEWWWWNKDKASNLTKALASGSSLQ